MPNIGKQQIEFMRKACLLCDNASCGYKTGCVVVDKDTVLFETWNETLSGEIYCKNGNCIRETLGLHGGKNIDKVCTIHAEAVAVAKAASQGVRIAGATFYVTTFPCYICAKLLVKASISKLFYMVPYMGENNGLVLFETNGIEVGRIPEDVVWST